MIKSHLLSVVILLSFVTACSQTVRSLKESSQEIQTLESDKGYLLIGIDTEYNLKNISIDGPDFIRLSHKDLKKGSSFILLPLESGKYNITHVAYSYGFVSKMIDENNWGFTIKPQTISYVGHMEIHNELFWGRFMSLELVNRSTEAIDFMELKFPAILQDRDLFYGGPGEDEYFQYLKKIGG